MKKGIIILILFLCSIMAIYYLMKPKYSFEVFKSQNEIITITKVKVSNRINADKFYFTFNEYNYNEIPTSYLKVEIEGRHSGYDLFFYKINDSLFVYRVGLSFGEPHNLPERVSYIEDLKNISWDELKNNDTIEKIHILGTE